MARYLCVWLDFRDMEPVVFFLVLHNSPLMRSLFYVQTFVQRLIAKMIAKSCQVSNVTPLGYRSSTDLIRAGLLEWKPSLKVLLVSSIQGWSRLLLLLLFCGHFPCLKCVIHNFRKRKLSIGEEVAAGWKGKKVDLGRCGHECSPVVARAEGLMLGSPPPNPKIPGSIRHGNTYLTSLPLVSGNTIWRHFDWSAFAAMDV